MLHHYTLFKIQPYVQQRLIGRTRRTRRVFLYTGNAVLILMNGCDATLMFTHMNMMGAYVYIAGDTSITHKQRLQIVFSVMTMSAPLFQIYYEDYLSFVHNGFARNASIIIEIHGPGAVQDTDYDVIATLAAHSVWIPSIAYLDVDVYTWNVITVAAANGTRVDFCSKRRIYGVMCDRAGHVVAIQNSINIVTFSGISLPDSIGNLTYLQELTLLSSDIQGAIPDTLCQLYHLEVLSLDNNALTSFPGCISNQTTPRLRMLTLSANQIRNDVQFSVATIISLEVLNLMNNQLSLYPYGVEDLPSIYYIDVSNNQITTHISMICPQANSHISYFNIAKNNIYGTVRVDCFNDMPALQTLMIGNNPYDANGTLPSLVRTSALVYPFISIMQILRVTTRKRGIFHC
jgi:hypothetical protein